MAGQVEDAIFLLPETSKRHVRQAWLEIDVCAAQCSSPLHVTWQPWWMRGNYTQEWPVFSNTLPPIIGPGSGGGHFCSALRKYTVSRLNLLRLSSRLRGRRQPHSACCLIWAGEIKIEPTGTQVEPPVTWNGPEIAARACVHTRADECTRRASANLFLTRLSVVDSG